VLATDELEFFCYALMIALPFKIVKFRQASKTIKYVMGSAGLKK
jgi:hypothetical protein